MDSPNPQTQPQVYRFASGGFGMGVRRPTQQTLNRSLGLGDRSTAEASPSMPRFRNPATALGFTVPPSLCNWPPSPSSLSPDSSRVASPVHSGDGSCVASPVGSVDRSGMVSPLPVETRCVRDGLSTPPPLPCDVSPSESSCHCQRPQSVILCSSCGFTFNGRVRVTCAAHPSQIYLMDNESCPECRSTCLKEYRTV